ncbi:MAG: hypothetical protein IRZ16_09370 [Myxococcaceae bacterium]|nr:hypothetical protein [Myxococcaceae bacterium]
MPGGPRGPRRPNPLNRASRFLAKFRFLFMPVGLFALIAVGVHAAADTLDDRILWVVDHVDAAFDALFGRWSATESWVHAIDLEDRTTIARAFALVWELLADLVLALPAFGYREATDRPVRGISAVLGTSRRRWRDIFRDVVRRPTVLRVTRPLATAAVVIAGACAIGRMVQGAVYLSQREWLGDAASGLLARLLALAALCGVLAAFGMRAVLRNLQHADEAATGTPGLRYVQIAAKGIPGSAVVIPLAIAALIDASPIWTFFR